MMVAVAMTVAACTSGAAADVIAVRSDTAPTVDTAPPTTATPTTAPTPTTEPDPVGPTSTAPTDAGPDETQPDAASGEDGLGDVLFPDLGNPGVDVVNYALDLAYDPDNDLVEGSVLLTIDVTDTRSNFTLDSAGPEVSAVTVDGEEAPFDHDGPELRISPAGGVAEGTRIDVLVEYSVITGRAESVSGLVSGWSPTPGGSVVFNEPDGARTWLPSNDHPSDKATWTISLTVPTGTTAVANGALENSVDSPEGSTWVWREDDPMPTYLVLLVTGDYELITGAGPNGVPLLSAVLRSDRQRMQPFIDTIGLQIDFFDDLFGPYPLDRYGLLFADIDGGYAMETQGRSMFSREDFVDGDLGYVQQLFLSHELAHQWFGDAVSPATWSDIWLNESFATYGEWMWLDHAGVSAIDDEANSALTIRSEEPGNATATPDVDEMFGFNSYAGGAVVLHALRATIGDERFFETLRRWVAENTGESKTTADFTSLAAEVSGTDLDAFFDDWLFAAQLPAGFP